MLQDEMMQCAVWVRMEMGRWLMGMNMLTSSFISFDSFERDSVACQCQLCFRKPIYCERVRTSYLPLTSTAFLLGLCPAADVCLIPLVCCLYRPSKLHSCLLYVAAVNSVTVHATCDSACRLRRRRGCGEVGGDSAAARVSSRVLLSR